MKTFDTNINELEKYLYQELITQSQLDEDRVLNALSSYGTELDKAISYRDDAGQIISEDDSNIYDGITKFDTTLLFELKSRDSNNNVSMIEYDETLNKDVIIYYKAFTLKIIIYGEDSTNLAINIISRFRTEAVRNSLYEKGIYLENVTEQQTINEYKNEAMWLRNDFDINIGIKQKIEQITTESNFDNIDITILK